MASSSAMRSPVPSSVQPAQPRLPIFKSAKDKVNPDAARDAARNKISKLESVERLHRPGGGCSEVQAGARQAAKAPPLKVKITSTQDFIRRSERLVAELEGRPGSVCAGWRPPIVQKKRLFRPASHHPPWVWETKCGRTLQQPQEERWPRKSRVALWRDTECAGGCLRHTVSGDVIPPMPTLVPRELTEWMEDRQSSMQEAMSCGNLNKTLELTSPQPQAAERLAEMTGGMVP